MFTVYKRVGETPLQCLDRIRKSIASITDATLSYAGRLDPMAEGVMPILVDEENKNNQPYLDLNKEYIVTFLHGIRTDTGDVLGKITALSTGTEDSVLETIQSFTHIQEQTYPWFSSKTVAGKKLFEHYLAGNLNIRRPIRKVQIHESILLQQYVISGSDLLQYVQEKITGVQGDFRQTEILQDWEKIDIHQQYTCTTAKVVTGSGVYIRALTEQFQYPALVLQLQRTRVFRR